MKVIKFFYVSVYIFDIFCFDNYYSIWVFQKKTLNSFVDIEGFSDKNINGKRFEMLVQRNNNDGIFFFFSFVNDSGEVFNIFD